MKNYYQNHTKIIVWILLSILILSCVQDLDLDGDGDGYNEVENFYYNTAIFVGIDSILYVEKYNKTRYESGFLGYGSGRTLDSQTQFVIINRQGQDLSAIWTQNLESEQELRISSSYSASFSKEAGKVFIGFFIAVETEGGFPHGIMIINLKGEVISYFLDDDLIYKISEGQYGVYCIHSSPNGLYYTAGKKIKNTSGNTIKTIDKEILDWNSNGLLVRDTSINTEVINIEGNNYKVYSHPTAKTWLGANYNYLYLNNDSLIIQNWHDSSISQKIYTPYFPMDNNFNFNSSMISPDLKYIVHQGSGYSDIQLLNLSNGESHMIKEIPSVNVTFH